MQSSPARPPKLVLFLLFALPFALALRAPEPAPRQRRDLSTVPASYPLQVVVDGDGTVASTPEGIHCPGDCSHSFGSGAQVALQAQPAIGYRLFAWGGACTGAQPDCEVTMTEAREVSATFASQSYTLTVRNVGNGNGTVTSTPPGIHCGNDCSALLPAGASVTLTAAPDDDSLFSGWSGACSGNNQMCDVTLDASQVVTATFAIRTFEVTVEIAGDGTVISDPPGIVCGSDCSHAYPMGALVILTAQPEAGAGFVAWGGACQGAAPVCSFLMNETRAVLATFGPTKPLYLPLLP